MKPAPELSRLLAVRVDGRWMTAGRVALVAALEAEGRAHAPGMSSRFRTRIVARQLSVTPAMLRKLLDGRRRPSIDLAARIAVLFGVDGHAWGMRPMAQARLSGAIDCDRPVARSGSPPHSLVHGQPVPKSPRSQRVNAAAADDPTPCGASFA